MNNATKDREVSRKYQQNISDVNYTPTKPASVPANFTFAGWYDNEPCGGTAYDFSGKTMPAQSITLYAKWQAPQVNATVYLSASADGESVTIEIPYGTKLSDSEDFKALLEKFKEEQPSAWIDSNGALFNVDTELYSSVTISPFFPSAKDGFTVTYVEGENVKTDNQKYVSGSSARVLPPENSENFRAWKTEDGKLIHPGDKITVTKNTTLTAVYTNKPQTVTIKYHYNFGGSTLTFIDSNYPKNTGYPKNTTATVRSYDYVGFTEPTGYKFLGWATTPDSNKIEYAAGDPVFVDANGDNNLYAVWQVKTYTVTWVDEDGTTLIDQKDYEYGAMPKFEGVEPTKAADAQYTYMFKGWDKDYTEVKGNQTYVAVYEKTTNKYTVTWVDEDGTTLIDQKDYEYGAIPKFEGVEPTKAADAQYTYMFKGWDKD
ncbi:InlB B-repeat-containing protein, partial [Hominenteromicrobium sp.]|uniref:InlB B-repeat-containing protein n=1 Tax=Hominenteromicrobium sp. TaxID=3073581 RepID=UPI003AF86A1C